MKQKLTAERKKLQEQFIKDLGDSVLDYSDTGERPLIVKISKPYEMTLTVYLFPGTNPPGGRSRDEYKFNLSVPNQKPGMKGNFDSTEGIPILIAYVKDYDVYVIFDCEYHKNFACNANQQFKQSLLLEALDEDLSLQKRKSGEKILGVYAPKILEGIKKWIDIAYVK